MQTMQTAVDDFEQELEPLVQARNLADWDAAIDASDEHEQQLVEASKRVDAVLAERERYAQLVEADRGGGRRRAARAARAPGASGERGRRSASAPWRIASSRPRLVWARCSRATAGSCGGRDVNDNEIAKVLRESSDRDERREAWDASKSIGPHAAPLVRELAHLRNEAARALGYRDHFVFSLTLDELDEIWLLGCSTISTAASSATWERTKAAIDQGQRERLGLAAGEPLQPWDYADAFFQDAPTASDDPLEAALGHLDPVRGRARLLPGARRRRRRRARAQRSLPARRQEPARVLRRHRPAPRRARARELRAGHALARRRWCTSSGTRSTTSRSTPSCRGSCASRRTRSRPRRSRCCTAASCATRRSSSASRASRPRSRAIRATPRCSAASCSSSRPGCR